MGNTDPRVDAYIEKSAEFARPILNHLRKLVHANCPEAEETIKWGTPHFEYKGLLCGMAAFKQHCTFGFWKGELVVDGEQRDEAMGDFGRIASLKDLPRDSVLAEYIKQAAALNDRGVPAPHMAERKRRPELPVPDDLARALSENTRAKATFDKFPPSQRREYIEWITEAKTDATRQRRLATALDWMAEGKPRNWKYMKKAGR